MCLLAGTLGQGGAERQLFYIASTLKRSGAEVLVLSLTAGELWETRLQAARIPVRFVGGSSSRLKRAFQISRAVRACRPGIVQGQHFYTNAYAAIAGRLAGARSVGGVRSNGFSELQDCGPLMGRVCLRFPNLLAANSRSALRNLQGLGCQPGKLHYLRNVIDTDQFHVAGNRNGGFPVILGIGRLGPEKKFDRFLRVLSLVRKSSGIPFRALIAGSGPLQAELEKLALAAGLTPDIVQFCGNVTDINSLYQKADLLLLTSEHEGSPNVVMEAMASGLPVVATAVGGVPELVRHGTTGFLADPDDEPGLAEAVGRLLRDDGLRLEMSSRARLFVEAGHSLDSLPAQLEALYQRVLPRKWNAPGPFAAKAL